MFNEGEACVTHINRTDGNWVEKVKILLRTHDQFYLLKGDYMTRGTFASWELSYLTRSTQDVPKIRWKRNYKITGS